MKQKPLETLSALCNLKPKKTSYLTLLHTDSLSPPRRTLPSFQQVRISDQQSRLCANNAPHINIKWHTKLMNDQSSVSGNRRAKHFTLNGHYRRETKICNLNEPLQKYLTNSQLR